MNIKKYIDKNGNEKIYNYDYSEYYKKYNSKRNREICRLQKQKSYYKKTGRLDKVEAIDLLIRIEKRKGEKVWNG